MSSRDTKACINSGGSGSASPTNAQKRMKAGQDARLGEKAVAGLGPKDEMLARLGKPRWGDSGGQTHSASFSVRSSKFRLSR